MTPTPDPHQRGKSRQQEARSWEPGGRALGQEAAAPPPPPTTCCPPTSGSPSPHWPPAPAQQPSAQPASLQRRRRGERRGPQEGAASTGQREEELGSAERSFVLWFDISLDSMLQFSFCCFGVFYFIFPGGGEEEECLRSSVATTLLFSLLQM